MKRLVWLILTWCTWKVRWIYGGIMWSPAPIYELIICTRGLPLPKCRRLPFNRGLHSCHLEANKAKWMKVKSINKSVTYKLLHLCHPFWNGVREARVNLFFKCFLRPGWVRLEMLESINHSLWIWGTWVHHNIKQYWFIWSFATVYGKPKIGLQE